MEINEEHSEKLEEIVLNGYKLLDLIHYFTVGIFILIYSI